MLMRRHGCYHPAANNIYNFDVVEEMMMRKFDVYSTFISMDSTAVTHTEYMTASQRGKILLVGWKPTRTMGLTFADILAGKYDAKIDEWLNYFASMPGPVVIRWAWEMNGSFMQYSPLYSHAAIDSSHCLSPEQYIEVWRYVRNRQSGNVKNIRWCFCPNQNDAPGVATNALERFWPGESYVDIVGYDSYNGLNGVWMSPEQTLAGYTNSSQLNTYDRVTVLHPTASVWVCETGCVDSDDAKEIKPKVSAGHNKARWIEQLFALEETVLPRLTTICWFNTKGTRDWRFDSSEAAKQVFITNFLL